MNSIYRLAPHIRALHLTEENDFKLTHSIFQQLDEQLDMVFICNPNNPTGRAQSKEFMIELAQRCKKMDILLIVDECFSDFLLEESAHSLKGESFENVVILKAFTKIYAMAGLRLGFLLCQNPIICQKIQECLQPWSVSTVASVAGEAVLMEEEYIDKTKIFIGKQREFLQINLEQLGYKVTDSDTNYILFKSKHVDLDIKLKKKGILIRNCENFQGLSSGYFRIAVKSREHNIMFIEKLKEVTDNG